MTAGVVGLSPSAIGTYNCVITQSDHLIEKLFLKAHAQLHGYWIITTCVACTIIIVVCVCIVHMLI